MKVKPASEAGEGGKKVKAMSEAEMLAAQVRRTRGEGERGSS